MKVYGSSGVDSETHRRKKMFGLFEEAAKLVGNVATIVTKPIELAIHIVNQPIESMADQLTESVENIKEN